MTSIPTASLPTGGKYYDFDSVTVKGMKIQSDIKKTIIYKVRFVDKWVEFWSKKLKRAKAGWDMSCKGYMLQNVINEAGIRDYIDEHGLIGCVITWEKVGEYNYHPKSIGIPRSKRKQYYKTIDVTKFMRGLSDIIDKCDGTEKKIIIDSIPS